VKQADHVHSLLDHKTEEEEVKVGTLTEIAGSLSWDALESEIKKVQAKYKI
jgi:hypothetical protein